MKRDGSRPIRSSSSPIVKQGNFLKAMHKRMISLLGLVLLAAASICSADQLSEGRALYLRNCAACHGVNADGKGPAAPALSTKAADLRSLSARYGNPLPQDQIARFIDGRADVIAHGPRDMPVWGEKVWEYPEGRGNQEQVTPRVAALIAYLQSIQKVARNVSYEMH
jgi:mono/diheme cytochrome c family protein